MRLESILVLALAGVLACEEAGGDGQEGGGESSPSSTSPQESNGTGGSDSDGPSEAAIGECRDACDSQLSWDCIDADIHEACWNVCPERSESDIDLFAACVFNTTGVCTPDCLENFLDADPVDPTGPVETTAGSGPSDTTSGGSVGVSCEDACEEFLGRGCTLEVEGFESCAGFCASLDPSLHDFVVMCVDEADGCMLPEQCSFPGE